MPKVSLISLALLYFPIVLGHIQIVRFLCSLDPSSCRGRIDVNAADVQGNTALHILCQSQLENQQSLQVMLIKTVQQLYLMSLSVCILCQLNKKVIESIIHYLLEPPFYSFCVCYSIWVLTVMQKM